jgi:hypothetical protein
MQIVLMEICAVFRQPKRDVFGAGRIPAQNVTYFHCSSAEVLLGERLELTRLKRNVRFELRCEPSVAAPKQTDIWY